ncbi:MAG TPA: SDR family oxidoreductase [Blastocatellia bacterium]|nr:SDR family oxidoreductase [Blastocatellia bacterium]
MDLELQGKVAIVTGSSDGIGYATALALAREGTRTVICGRREPLLAEARDKIARETGTELLTVPCDVQRLTDVQRLVRETMERFGAIHILVNNAGSVPSMQFTDVDDAQWHEMLEGKLLSYIRVTREIVPHMRKAGWGRIINIAGGGGRQPTATGMAVGVNNAAVINWTKSLSLQYAADGILVTAIAPGKVDTPRQIRNRVRESEIRGITLEALQGEGVHDIPLKRIGRPEEVANVVVFLASECSSYMTGTCVVVDGGVTRGI